MNHLNEQEIKVFVDAVRGYFNHLESDEATIRTAYLADLQRPLPVLDYAGLIQISGDYAGYVYFTSEKNMVRFLLRTLKEPEDSEAFYLDAVGEIANTIAGNSRRHFGAGLDIAPPKTYSGRPPVLNVRERPYVILMSWRHYQAAVVVDIEQKN